MTEILIALISALTGGGLTGIFYWRANQRKAIGEAMHTEADAMKSAQEFYQKAMDDMTGITDRLRADRDHLREDRNEMREENEKLRKRQNELDEKVRQLEYDVARNGRMVESLRPFLCGRINCPDRTKVDLGSNCGKEHLTKPVTASQAKKSKEKNDE